MGLVFNCFVFPPHLYLSDLVVTRNPQGDEST
jgi:hypothetical protein